ncbi:unnamed protein product, partial [Mesorhabditis belari]|uniref:General transcription factor 3C polypeptide 3 n=1 Tax=Mesorhabditis belari TaxID=2138241 RepID=A0AAF3FD02_9BILA
MDQPSSSGYSDAYANLAPMRIRSESVRSTVAGYFEQQMMQGDGSGDAELSQDINESTGPQSEYDLALERFMRNEIDYDEFMKLTGGMQLGDEELENNVTFDDHEDGYDEEVDDDELLIKPEALLSAAKKPALTGQEEGNIPAETRNLVRELITDELGTGVAKPPTQSTPRPRKLNAALDSLLGQANLSYARGQTQHALDMLLEVIKQEPRHPESYRQVSEIYRELNQPHRSLHYGLLAAHLDYHTPAGEWSHLGDLSSRLEKYEESAACYGRAIRLEPNNWKDYEKRIATLDMLGMRSLSMKTRLQAAQMIDHSTANVDFEWFSKLIKTVAEYYISINDEDKAIQALEAYVLRSKLFGREAESQHETLIKMWMAKDKFGEAAKSILALCSGIETKNPDGSSAVTVTFKNGTFTIEPYPPPASIYFEIEDSVSMNILCRLCVCLIKSNNKNLAQEAIPFLLRRSFNTREAEELTLDIARAYAQITAHPAARRFLEQLLDLGQFAHCANLWFLLGNALMQLEENQKAMEAYEKVLELNSSHVDARINLSGLQQRIGLSDRALETLRDYDLDTCTYLPDERLLIRQVDVLFDQGRYEQFIRCARMLLTPYFYEVYARPELFAKRKSGPHKGTAFAISNTLCSHALTALRNTPLEKFVKRLGSIAIADGRTVDGLTAVQLHDYSLRLIEQLEVLGRYQDMLGVCCYAFLQPKIQKTSSTENFKSILFYCAIKAENWLLGFEYVRWLHTSVIQSAGDFPPNHREVLFRRIFNAMNYIFCHSQQVSYHRYIMRSLAKSSGNHALQTISGNNSLITGTYRHALCEYFKVWSDNRNNALICFLIGLTFIHMSCKKDLSSRHMVALRGLAFVKRYEKMRTVRQEVYYNLGRMLHQLSITPLAIHFYKLALAEPSPVIVTYDEDGNEHLECLDKYDLRHFAAHNLVLIYRASGNDILARNIYQKYCIV